MPPEQTGLSEKVKEWFIGLFKTDASQQDAAVGFRPIRLTKDFDGSTRATIIFSNNFEDRHEQTIPEVVHENYLNWADQTKLYPEFQIWHMGTKSRWGQGDLVTRIGHFTVVSGKVDPDKEELAIAFANDPRTGVSNGYYGLYADAGHKEFCAWWPYEVSALPAVASANIWLANEHILESEGFLMKAEHKALLKERGCDENFLVALEADILARGGQVEQAGVGSKEVEQPAPVIEPTTDMATLLGNVLDQKMTPLIERISALENGQKSLQEDVKKTVDDTIIAQVASLPQGFKATEQPGNIVQQLPNGEPTAMDYDWLGKELDGIMKSNGVNV